MNRDPDWYWDAWEWEHAHDADRVWRVGVWRECVKTTVKDRLVLLALVLFWVMVFGVVSWAA